MANYDSKGTSKHNTHLNWKVLEPGNEYLFHLTHIKNLASIFRHGILSKAALQELSLPFTDISNPKVQTIRSRINIYDRPLQNYALSFVTPRNPMMYCLRDMADELAWVIVDSRKIPEEICVTSDRNLASNGAQYNTGLDGDIIDWDIIQSSNWISHEQGKQKRSAEVLVLKKIPTSAFTAVALGNPKLNNWFSKQCNIPVGQMNRAFMLQQAI